MAIRVSDDVEDGCLLCGDVVVQSGESVNAFLAVDRWKGC
jgi:hypothetical protein